MGNGAQVLGASSDGVTPAPVDSRVGDIYSGERKSLSFGEALEVLHKSLRFFRPHRRLVMVKFTIAVSSMLMFLLVPWPMKLIIDNVIDAHPLTGVAARILRPLVGDDRMALLGLIATFLLTVALLCGISAEGPLPLNTDTGTGGLDETGAGSVRANNGWSVFNGLLGFVETTITLELSQRVNQDLRVAVYTHFLRSPIGLYGDQKIGDAVFRVMNDSAGIGDVFYRGLVRPTMALVMFFAALTVICTQFSNEPLIVLGAALVMPLVAVASGLFSRVFRNRAQTMRERGAAIMATFEERLANIQLIKAFGTEARETEAVEADSWASFSATLKLVAFAVVMVLILAPPLVFLLVAAMLHLFGEVIDGRLTLGDMVLILSYAAMLARPAADFGGTWALLQEPIAGLRRVFSVLDRPGEDAPLESAAEPDAISRLEMRNVAIAYAGGAPVVHDIGFELRTGELVALAGPSGTGKTTIVTAIPRFIGLAAGEVLLNGIDARRISLEVLRDRIGFVFQQEALFARSIADNIRYGTPAASDAQVREAARLARAADFIETLPEQYATMLGRRGARLSVGQKQRIAIARALLRQPEVLILDEPTAPLDPESETALMHTLRELARDRIVLIVAHRASTLSICDRVLFVSHGTMVASGSDAELRNACPAYREYLAIAE